MCYRAIFESWVSLALLCILSSRGCRLPPLLMVWFSLPMRLCWPSCKCLENAVSLSQPLCVSCSRQVPHILASEMPPPSFKTLTRDHRLPTLIFHEQYYLLLWEINTNETQSTINTLWLLQFPTAIASTSREPLGMTHRPDGVLWDFSCPPGQGLHALGCLWGADATCTSGKPVPVLVMAPDRGCAKGHRKPLPHSTSHLFFKVAFPIAGKRHFCIFQAVALSCGQASSEESCIPSRSLQHWHVTQ